MKTWKDYKNPVKNLSEDSRNNMENIEIMAEIISAIVEQRTSLGLSQRELAAQCEIPQSTLARIESFKTSPNLDTLLKIMQPLGLSLAVTPANPLV